MRVSTLPFKVSAPVRGQSGLLLCMQLGPLPVTSGLAASGRCRPHTRALPPAQTATLPPIPSMCTAASHPCPSPTLLQGQEATKFVFQGVHETICFGPAAAGWQAGEAPLNQIVFIGRDLNRRVRLGAARSCRGWAGGGRWPAGLGRTVANPHPQPCVAARPAPRS